ncbi:MAG: hypothetical protein DYG89_02100 [Caldilinea sp. CFX5]|nr:hypothetical protein [Caldilinea sp. CFX5]
MTITDLLLIAGNKNNFSTVKDYLEFCCRYLDFIETGVQAVIVSQNEPNYHFLQYRQDGHFNITRPLNINLLFTNDSVGRLREQFLTILRNATHISLTDGSTRSFICSAIYTIQQAIGATLDALPAGRSNTARKLNGDLFERLIRLLVNEVGIDCRSGVINVPVMVDGMEAFRMSYQHDLLFYRENNLKVIGSVKTSSKDRLDKIFVDKFLYSRLTETTIPHIAIFLNDVQRKQTIFENRYGINSTFLPGHFKGYTIKLNPLDGVYYCDIRPTMASDLFLRRHIKTIDSLFCDDLNTLLADSGRENGD